MHKMAGSFLFSTIQPRQGPSRDAGDQPWRSPEVRSDQTGDAGPRTSYDGGQKVEAMDRVPQQKKGQRTQGLLRRWYGVRQPLRRDLNFGFDEGPSLRAQNPSERPDWEDGCGIRIEELFCSMG